MSCPGQGKWQAKPAACYRIWTVFVHLNSCHNNYYTTKKTHRYICGSGVIFNLGLNKFHQLQALSSIAFQCNIWFTYRLRSCSKVSSEGVGGVYSALRIIALSNSMQSARLSCCDLVLSDLTMRKPSFEILVLCWMKHNIMWLITTNIDFIWARDIKLIRFIYAFSVI